MTIFSQTGENKENSVWQCGNSTVALHSSPIAMDSTGAHGCKAGWNNHTWLVSNENSGSKSSWRNQGITKRSKKGLFLSFICRDCWQQRRPSTEPNDFNAAPLIQHYAPVTPLKIPVFSQSQLWIVTIIIHYIAKDMWHLTLTPKCRTS